MKVLVSICKRGGDIMELVSFKSALHAEKVYIQDKLKSGNSNMKEDFQKALQGDAANFSNSDFIGKEGKVSISHIDNSEKINSSNINALAKEEKKDINLSNSNFIASTPISKKTAFNDIISEMSSKYSVPAKLISKVIQAESNFDPNAVSPVGAQGLMQLMPKTAEWLGVKNPYDPKENIEGGVKYLKSMLNKYDGDLSLALAAYNAGPGNVDKFQGIPPFKETEDYVEKILKSYSE